MKSFVIAIVGVMLLVPLVGLGQQTDAELEQMFDAFGRRAESDSMSIMVIHMNDITTDALFTAPAKYSLRAQARGATMFYVQGTAKEDITIDMEWEVALGTRTTRPQVLSITNFERGLELKAGDPFTGIIALTELINLNQPFVVKNSNWRFEFTFPSSVINQLEASNE